MKKLDFNFSITNLKGEIISEFIVKESVANMLSGQATRTPQKSMELARKIYVTGIIEVTSEDELIIKNCILSNNQITDLVKDQLLNIFEEPKTAE